MPRRYRRRRTGGLSDVVLGVLQRPTSGMYRRRRRRTHRRTGGGMLLSGSNLQEAATKLRQQTPLFGVVLPGKPSGYYKKTSGMYRRRRRRTTRRRRTGGGLGTGFIKTNVVSMPKGPMLSLQQVNDMISRIRSK